MTRVCKLASCNNPVSSPRAEFCKPAHRAAFWRSQHVVAGERPHPRAGANARSGRQVSLEKAVERVAETLRALRPSLTEDMARSIARGALMDVLPERQRERS